MLVRQENGMMNQLPHRALNPVTNKGQHILYLPMSFLPSSQNQQLCQVAATLQV